MDIFFAVNAVRSCQSTARFSILQSYPEEMKKVIIMKTMTFVRFLRISFPEAP